MANSPLNSSFSKFSSDDPREFPAIGVFANSPADAVSAGLYSCFTLPLQ
jgi:hypothetical protein